MITYHKKEEKFRLFKFSKLKVYTIKAKVHIT